VLALPNDCLILSGEEDEQDEQDEQDEPTPLRPSVHIQMGVVNPP